MIKQVKQTVGCTNRFRFKPFAHLLCRKKVLEKGSNVYFKIAHSQMLDQCQWKRR